MPSTRTARMLPGAGLVLCLGLMACDGGPAVSPTVTPPAATPTTSASESGLEPTAAPARSSAPARPLSSDVLRAAVTSERIHAHLVELQRIADEHGGSRASGTSGFDASVAYVAGRLQAAGYRVSEQPFSFNDAAVDQSSVNLIADLPGRDASRVLMLGAHLDSAPGGPGINDNGSGVMTLLEIAERLAELERPHRSVRFAFWGAEEPGLYGSTAYVESLATGERGRLVAYLNFDVLGSTNYVRFIYADAGAPPGSETITELFAAHFDSVALAWDTFDLTGKTDHAAFSRAGIPTGGLFSGGQELVTRAQAAARGGTAGAPADPCSDADCDTIANVNDAALEEMAAAIAHALATLANDE